MGPDIRDSWQQFCEQSYKNSLKIIQYSNTLVSLPFLLFLSWWNQTFQVKSQMRIQSREIFLDLINLQSKEDNDRKSLVTCLSLHRKSERKLETKVHLDPNQFVLITIGPLDSASSHVTSDSSAREEMGTLNHQAMPKN